MNKAPLIASYGGGVNSTAMLIGAVERGIIFDLITFADTGGEKPETYEYIWKFSEWLTDHGQQSITMVRNRSKYASLEDNCLKTQWLPSKTYGFSSCSQKWKLDPQRRLINNWAPAKAAWKNGQKVTKAIGYGVDEIRRAKISDDEKYHYWYPLIEWKWDRECCVEVILHVGLTVPIKSACFFCPSSKKKEVLWLAATHPDLFQRAVDMENNSAWRHEKVKGLGRHWSWKALVEGDEAAKKAMEAPELPCACWDGEDEED